MTAAWRLHAHGSPRLQTDSDDPSCVALSRKDAALLAYVALNAGAPSARVATLLWPGSDERAALNNLRQRLHRLRRATGARLLEVTGTAAIASDLRCRAEPEVAALEADPNAWDGELLGGHDYDDASEFAAWLAAARKAWADARRDALAGIASAAEQGGEIARALVYAQRLLADDPLSEHAHRRVMRLHYLRGDTAAAVAAFEACERTLKDELGIKPSAETIELLRVIERSAMPVPSGVASPVPASLLRPPSAVGRAAERASLEQAHRDGLIATLVGEAGIGKTRLLQDFTATEPQAVYAQARPGDASVPYGALARLLRAVLAAAPPALEHAPRSELARVVPEVGDGTLASPAAQAARLQQAIEQLLAAALAGEVRSLVVDDLHFADRASVEMLRALVDSERLVGMRWVFAHRPIGAADEDVALLRSLADSPRARWIALPPLGNAELVELLESLALPGTDAAALAPALAQHTGGNPLYVLETLRAAHLARAVAEASSTLALPRPQSIAHMIDRRLGRLSERALALGRVAALAGPDFSPELAEHALGTPALLLAGAWAELEAADVLRGSAFAHDLVRDGMLRATPAPIAVHAHRMIANYLERQGAEPARVAEHWRSAGAHAEASAAFRQAAERAYKAGRPREQAQLLLSAADAVQADGDPDAALALRSTALRPLLHGQGLAPADALSQSLVDASSGVAMTGLAWARRASLMMTAGQAAEAERAARRALELLGRDQLVLRAEATAALAIALQATGKAEDGLELLRPWIDRIDAIDDALVRIELCSAHAVLLYHREQLDEAAVALERQIEQVRLSGESGEHGITLLSLGSLQLRRGAAEHAARSAQEAARHMDCDTPGVMPGYLRFVSGSALCALGRYAEGLELLDAARVMLADQSQGTMVHSNAESAQAEVLLQIGQPARALQLLGTDPADLRASGKVRRLLARAAIARALGQSSRKALDDALAEVERGAGQYFHMLAQIELAQRAEPEPAIEICASVLSRARRHGDHVVGVLASMVRLDALRRSGRTDGLAEAAFDLDEQLQSCRSTLIYRPEALLVCGRAYAAARRSDAADRCLNEARQWIRTVALPNIPDVFREGFLHRCAVNVAIQGEASRSGDRHSDKRRSRLP